MCKGNGKYREVEREDREREINGGGEGERYIEREGERDIFI